MGSAQMILVPSKVHNDHFEEKSTKMTEFWARGHGVSIAVGIYALTQLDTDTAFKAAMAWVAGIGVAYPYNAKFNVRHLQGQVPDALRARGPHGRPPRRRLRREPGRVDARPPRSLIH